MISKRRANLPARRVNKTRPSVRCTQERLLVKTDLPHTVVERASSDCTGRGAGIGLRLNLAERKILIVDDNPVNLKLIRILLVGEGYDVHTADAEEALRVLQDLRPRLILMDIQLLGIGGLELTRQLKANPLTRDIRVLGLTAYAMKGDEEKILAAGCDGYISKPIDTRVLPGMIERHLEY
jgi:two-component system, cell cycle response regulator DivK